MSYGFRQLQRYTLCDLEIISYPHAVLVKSLVDIIYLQLVTGSGEGQNLTSEPKARWIFKGARRTANQAQGLPGVIGISS